MASQRGFQKYVVPDAGGAYTEQYHDLFRNSPWIVVRNICTELSEGDVATVFSQFGEVVDVRFARNAKTGVFYGRGYVRFADCRSCILAADNMNSFRPGMGPWVFLVESDDVPLDVDHAELNEIPKLPPATESYGQWYQKAMLQD